jgi:acyl-CoA hydrolase
VVTLSVDQVTFKQPIHVGELVTFLASVNMVGTSSMEIGVKVVAEDVRNGVVRHTNSCYFTMVAVDQQLKPIAIEPLEPETEIAKRRERDARSRKQSAIELQKQRRHNRTAV